MNPCDALKLVMPSSYAIDLATLARSLSLISRFSSRRSLNHCRSLSSSSGCGLLPAPGSRRTVATDRDVSFAISSNFVRFFLHLRNMESVIPFDCAYLFRLSSVESAPRIMFSFWRNVKLLRTGAILEL